MGGSPQPIAGKCGAKLRNSEKKCGHARYCKQDPMVGKTRCKLHGAKSLAGFEHPRFGTGATSKVLQGLRLGEHFESIRHSPGLVDLSDPIALVYARVLEQIEQLASGDGPIAWKRGLEVWQTAEDALDKLRQAQRQPAGPNRGAAIADALRGVEQAITAAGAVMRKGVSDAEAWPHILTTIAMQRKLVDSETKRRKAASEVLLKAQVLTIMQSIAASIMKNVTDPRAKNAVISDIRLLVQGAGGQG
jgi:hypothetical protein